MQTSTSCPLSLSVFFFAGAFSAVNRCAYGPPCAPSRQIMRRNWLIGELQRLAQACPATGEEVVKQVYQWEHDASKAWSLALLGAALAFVGSAAVALLKDELNASSLTIWLLVSAAGLAVLFGVWTLHRLRALLPEYLTTVQTFTYLRNRAHPQGWA